MPERHGTRRAPARGIGPHVTERNDIAELIRVSNRLRQRSNAVQRAATRAGVELRDLVRRCVEVCGK
jgi:hypothetical protein